MNEETGKSRILIVDDTLKNIQVLGTILRTKGYQINIAKSGLQALEVVEKVLPDLILLDVMMPELDGFETCKRLKASDKTRDIPVIFLTAKVETDDIVKGFELGAVDYVTKPFNSVELLKRVESHMALSLLQRYLENRVAERTEELYNANVKLQEEHAERIEAERQLAQANRLEAIGQLAAGIAHEINSPMQFIGNNTEFLQQAFKELTEALDPYQKLLEQNKSDTITKESLKEVVEAIEEADLSYILEQIPQALNQAQEGVDRVNKIVVAMRDFSHPGTKDKVMVDLNKTVESATVVSRNEWKYVADLELDLDPSLPEVPCLPSEFSQVVLNLVVNAAHAIADVVGDGKKGKGKITVTTRLDGDAAEVSVRDTGTGIPEEVREKIFDPFFTTKQVGKGTGQGLSLSYDVMVNKLGGTISFDTETGQGTTFTIRIPREAAVKEEEKND